MTQTNVNIRMDDELKKEFDTVCGELGLSMTAAFTVFAKTVVRQQKIPFEISANVPNAETRAAIAEVQMMKKDPPSYKGYTDVEEMMKELRS
jgi:addiction module antitoxin, RelB/DinJ family